MIDWLEALDKRAFLLINAPAQPDALVLAIAKISASWLVAIVALALVVVWVVGRAPQRKALVFAGAALALGLAINWTITALWYHPRPFVAGLGHTFVAHAPETSFPSDHGTFLWSLGFGLLIAPGLRGLGLIVVGLGFVTAWARIYVGVHYPLDMAGSLAVSALAASGARALAPVLMRYVHPLAERLRARLAALIGAGRPG